jgi:hypothetical protein
MAGSLKAVPESKPQPSSDRVSCFSWPEVRRKVRKLFPQLLYGLVLTAGSLAQDPITVRTPATPLVVHDPYFSLWSFDDNLAAAPTRHWTGAEQQLNGFIRVDGQTFRFMGSNRIHPALPQVLRTIWPTRTIYDFEASGIHLTAAFFTPALLQNLEVLSRPITYLSWTVRSVDGRSQLAMAIRSCSDIADQPGPRNPATDGQA